MLASAPAQAQLLLDSEDVLVTEKIAPANFNMSGQAIKPLESEEFFTAIQLIHTQEPRSFQPSAMKHAPIWMPEAAKGQQTNVCTRIRSINGVYEAIVLVPVKPRDDAEGAYFFDAGDYRYASKYDPDKNGTIQSGGLYSTAQLKLNCVTDPSALYVPLSLGPNADTLQVVISIGNAAIRPTLARLDGTGETFELPCKRTTNVKDGFDCRLSLSRLPNGAPAPYALSVQIDFPGAQDPVVTAVVALPG